MGGEPQGDLVTHPVKVLRHEDLHELVAQRRRVRGRQVQEGHGPLEGRARALVPRVPRGHARPLRAAAGRAGRGVARRRAPGGGHEALQDGGPRRGGELRQREAQVGAQQQRHARRPLGAAQHGLGPPGEEAGEDAGGEPAEVLRLHRQERAVEAGGQVLQRGGRERPRRRRERVQEAALQQRLEAAHHRPEGLGDGVDDALQRVAHDERCLGVLHGAGHKALEGRRQVRLQLQGDVRRRAAPPAAGPAPREAVEHARQERDQRLRDVLVALERAQEVARGGCDAGQGLGDGRLQLPQHPAAAAAAAGDAAGPARVEGEGDGGDVRDAVQDRAEVRHPERRVHEVPGDARQQPVQPHRDRRVDPVEHPLPQPQQRRQRRRPRAPEPHGGPVGRVRRAVQRGRGGVGEGGARAAAQGEQHLRVAHLQPPRVGVAAERRGAVALRGPRGPGGAGRPDARGAVGARGARRRGRRIGGRGLVPAHEAAGGAVGGEDGGAPHDAEVPQAAHGHGVLQRRGPGARLVAGAPQALAPRRALRCARAAPREGGAGKRGAGEGHGRAWQGQGFRRGKEALQCLDDKGHRVCELDVSGATQRAEGHFEQCLDPCVFSKPLDHLRRKRREAGGAT